MRGVMQQDSDGAAGEACFGGVSPAGEYGGYTGSEDDAGELRPT